jgi:hypothetical protein
MKLPLRKCLSIGNHQSPITNRQSQMKYNPVMFEGYLVAENTTITAKGTGEAVDIGVPDHRILLAVLTITQQVEQEALDVAVFGSTDGVNWGAKPLLAFPQRFYTGETPLLLDLRSEPHIRFLRAQWDATRWGRGSETPTFTFSVKISEVDPALLSEASGQRA